MTDAEIDRLLWRKHKLAWLVRHPWVPTVKKVPHIHREDYPAGPDGTREYHTAWVRESRKIGAK